MDICDQIRKERRAGNVRCGVIAGRIGVTESARAFGLNILAVEKGEPGDRAFTEAFAAWRQ
jgi:hypothetical protein